MKLKNLMELFKAQKNFDDKVLGGKGLGREEVFEKKVLALLVELGEVAQEWRGFKFWSDRQEPKQIVYTSCHEDDADYFFCGKCHEKYDNQRANELSYDCFKCGNYLTPLKKTNPLLEEYVDSLHFLVSLGIDLGIEQVEIREIEDYKPIERQFIELSNMASLLVFQGGILKRIWNDLFSAFIRLGNDLGFTWDEVYNAYFEKIR